jgi:hypothetical protein
VDDVEIKFFEHFTIPCSRTFQPSSKFRWMFILLWRVVAEKRSLQQRELSRVDEVKILVPCELHGILGKLLASAEGTDSLPIGLSTRVWCQWQTTAWRGSEPTTENGLGQCAIIRSFLERKERSGDSPEAANQVNFDRRTAAVLFTTGGGKLKCDRLTATPATRLDVGRR